MGAFAIVPETTGKLEVFERNDYPFRIEGDWRWEEEAIVFNQLGS